MEKPKFKIPPQKASRTGRITIFLASVAAVSYLLVRFGNDYSNLYENSQATLPVITGAAISLTQFIKNNWWAIAAGAVLLTLLFRFATKSGTVFTVLSILVWLAGILGYLALWLPSRSLETTLKG